MDYKGKYNKLVEAVKVLQKANPSDEGIQNWINDNVPELKLSEDERIRKAIHIYLDWLDGRKDYAPKGEYSIKDMIAWLEKQGEKISVVDFKAEDWYVSKVDGKIYNAKFYENPSCVQIDKQDEQKSIDKVVPKFKVGDTIINIYHRWDGNDRIREIKDGKYIFDDGSYITIKEQDNWELADKNKPKFKAGDWVVFANGNVGHITSAGTHGYTFDDGDYLLHDNCDKQAHLWSITDAKDGDVLYSPCLNLLWIYKCRDTVYCGWNLNYNDGVFCGEGYFERPTDVIPATKEQRDALMKAMADAGYTFDFEKKELKEVKQKPTQEIEPFEAEHGKYYYCIKDYFCGGKKQASKGDVVQALRGLPIMGLKDASEYFLPVNFIKYNSAWSEEDSARLQRIIDFLWKNRKGDTDTIFQQEQDVAWLKSLKQRLGGEK